MRRLVAVFCIAAPTVTFAPALSAADYEKEVLPILKQHCYSCHDGRKQTAGLRLDVRTRAVKGGESGDPGIVNGKSAESTLVQRAASTDADIRMPPEGPGLSPVEIKTLKDWVDAGAPWPDSLAGDENAGLKHWSFQPPVRTAPPTDESGWSRNAIDNFVHARLHQEGLKPSPEADKATLLRRLSLDLVGLPPTVEELDAYLADGRPDAYSRQVERLLASPHYGERWGRTWLDAARYADSDGFEKDKPRFVWFYRDWVVNALNRDLPYDQFVIEQLAGDLLPNPTQDQVVATGFLRNSMINEEGGVDPEQFRMEAMFDRMDAIGKSVLGLTIQCAQCHDHKYDPISQADYYRLFAFLNNSTEGSSPVYTPPQLEKRAEILRKVSEIESNLKHALPDWDERLAEWERSLSAESKWTTARPELDTSGAQKHELLDDGSILAQGYAPTKSTTDFACAIADVPQITALRLEYLNDPNLPLNGPGRAINGLCALTEFTVDVLSPEPGSKPAKVKFVKATADANPAEAELDKMFGDKTNKRRVTGPIAYAIDGDPLTAWGIDIGAGRSNVPRTAVFLPDKPIDNPAGTRITFHLAQNHGGWNSDDNQTNNLGRFRLSVTGDTVAEAGVVPTDVREILKTPPGDRSSVQVDVLFSYWRTTNADWKSENEQIEAQWQSHPRPMSQLVLRDRENPRMTHLLKRGDFLKPAETVQPGVPGFLNSQLQEDATNRLALARWMTDRQSPTTARSIVNRIWQAYYGQGLVATSEDLGLQADAASHPELLDWLAVELMTGGSSGRPWSMKHIHRLVVTSQAYQLSSNPDDAPAENLTIDRENRLYWRANVRRLEGEIVRDAVFAAAGTLDRAVGGPDIPFEDGEKVSRRSLYFQTAYEKQMLMLTLFDAANPADCYRRTESVIPQQALALSNSPLFSTQSRTLAGKLSAAHNDDDAFMKEAFLRILNRHATSPELDACRGFLKNQQELLAKPDQLTPITGGAKPGVAPAGDPRLRARENLILVLFNHNDCVTVR